MIPNNERIAHAMKALGEPDVFEVEERVIDLMTNLFHLCASYNIDCERVVDIAFDHCDAEREAA